MTDKTVLYIKKGTERITRTPEELKETNNLTVGQCFLAVANYYEKTKDMYPRWISFDKNPGEFKLIKGIIDECSTDAEKIWLVCDWLGEECI